jgi:hypothetical protein
MNIYKNGFGKNQIHSTYIQFPLRNNRRRIGLRYIMISRILKTIICFIILLTNDHQYVYKLTFEILYNGYQKSYSKYF